MFRKLGGALLGKESILKKTEEKTAGIEAVFHSFLEQNFSPACRQAGAGAFKVGVEYHHVDSMLVLLPDNKILAGELSFKFPELIALFRQNGIGIKKIIVR